MAESLYRILATAEIEQAVDTKRGREGIYIYPTLDKGQWYAKWNNYGGNDGIFFRTVLEVSYHGDHAIGVGKGQLCVVAPNPVVIKAVHVQAKCWEDIDFNSQIGSWKPELEINPWK